MTDRPTIKLDPPRILDAPPTKLAGLSGEFTPATMRDISALWPPFIGELDGARISGVGGKVAWGAGFHCFDGSPSFQYLCAVEVSDFKGVPKGWTRLEVPKRRYAIFTHRDHVSRLGDLIETIRHDWLPSSGHTAALGGGAPDFLELYGEEFDPVSGMGGMEVWFPIKA